MKNAETLNDLIEINNDRVEGYEKASMQTTDEDLRSVFTNMASQSRRLADELKQLVRGEGEDPAQGTTMRGKIYRTWMDVKATFTGNNRKSLLASCEYGEDAAQRAYESALKEKDVSGDVRQTIEKQRTELRQSHDRVRDMRDAQPS
jgi:uncharacterized protein (TIGR02284 family)